MRARPRLGDPNEAAMKALVILLLLAAIVGVIWTVSRVPDPALAFVGFVALVLLGIGAIAFAIIWLLAKAQAS